MKILLCARGDYQKNPAGDSVQMIKTARYLQKKGFVVTINDGGIKNYSGYDFIHLFNLTRITETYQYFKLAQQYHKHIVITPIYWSLKKYYEYTESLEQVRLWFAYEKFRREILYGCDRVYPSSIMELELIKREYGEALPQTVVYNGIDPADFVMRERKRGEPKRKDDILCAARVCQRKNQLALAKAAHKMGVKLVLAGEANDKDYLKKCLSYKNVTYAGFLPLSQLAVRYRQAKLHALCSFVETPGLASLEAAAWGCNILSTQEGSAKEYFEDCAVYCDPYDKADLYRTIEAGLSFSEQPRLKARIFQKFNLEECLAPLYQSYLEVMEQP